MKFLAYWSAVARRALSEAWGLIGFELPARIIVAGPIYVVYVIFVWNWRGAEDATSDIEGTIAGLAAPLVILPLIYAWKFAETPWRMAKEDATQIAALQKAISGEQAPARDMTLGDLFRHMRPGVSGRDEAKDIGEKVHQAFVDGTLGVWGRRCATDQGWTGGPNDPVPSHESIAANMWPHAHFTYHFLETNSDNKCHVRWRAPQAVKAHYFDVRVNRAEAMKLWPSSV